MMRVYWYIAARFCEVRAQRAFRKYVEFRGMAEKFFHKIDGGQ